MYIYIYMISCVFLQRNYFPYLWSAYRPSTAFFHYPKVRYSSTAAEVKPATDGSGEYGSAVYLLCLYDDHQCAVAQIRAPISFRYPNTLGMYISEEELIPPPRPLFSIIWIWMFGYSVVLRVDTKHQVQRQYFRSICSPYFLTK